MKGSFFLDTNVLVYTFDRSAPEKRDIAVELVAQALSGHGAISYQVVQEFLNVATRKFAKPFTESEAAQYLDGVLTPLCTVHPGPDLYRMALQVHSNQGFSFYDSIIVASAHLAGCRTLYSEDMQSERVVLGLRIVNPFQT